MKHFVFSFIKYLTGLIELLLITRIILKFLGAGEKALIVKFFYFITDILTSPFKFIFPSFYFQKGWIDLTAFSAVVGYFILTIAILKFLNLIFPKK
ncbi:MAG: hypothetical protein AAB496_00685 [Patescibacteria group bacterium]